jgi:ubiquinone/menaquinone biosynthesis C-methylase UbiE
MRYTRIVGSRRQREIQAEFTRQAMQMASAPAFRAQAELGRLVKALGNASSDRVLDLACGPGILAEVLAPHVREVVGIDATLEMTRLAWDRFEKARLTNGHFEAAAAEELPYAAAQFEQVLTRLSFHHFEDVPSVLSEVRRVMQPRGRLIVADVISSEEPEEAALHNSLEKLRDPTHVRMFSGSELLDLLRVEGFRVLHHESWRQARAFPEWAAIIADPDRTVPLENVMRALARAGTSAGIALREESGELRFAHTWMLAIAMAD